VKEWFEKYNQTKGKDELYLVLRKLNISQEDAQNKLEVSAGVFAKKAVRERRIPFEITADNDPFYSSENISRLKRSIAEMERTGGTIHEVNLDD